MQISLNHAIGARVGIRPSRASFNPSQGEAVSVPSSFQSLPPLPPAYRPIALSSVRFGRSSHKKLGLLKTALGTVILTPALLLASGTANAAPIPPGGGSGSTPPITNVCQPPQQAAPTASGIFLYSEDAPEQICQRVNAGQVQSIEQDSNGIWKITYTDGSFQFYQPDKSDTGFSAMEQTLQAKQIYVQPVENVDYGAILFIILAALGLPILLTVANKKTGGRFFGGGTFGGQGSSSTKKMLGLSNTSAANGAVVDRPGDKLSDLRGIDEVVEELREMVGFLDNPTNMVGETLPKGLLLMGPPGTGKTKSARAIAGEANVPFIQTSGAEFIEMLVGVGASRIRDLYRYARILSAKEKKPVIIFMDEFETIGKKRQFGQGLNSGSDSEHDQTLNQLLKEMDGFEQGAPVIFIAATNSPPEELDPAITRPGRIDKKIIFNAPMTSQAREEILKGKLAEKSMKAGHKAFADDIDTATLAKQMHGMTGAEIENVVNEAALIARKRIMHSATPKSGVITQQDLNQAIEKILFGLPKDVSGFSPRDFRRVTVHEAFGHALIGYLNDDHLTIVTNIARNIQNVGTALGLVGKERSDQLFFTRNDVEKELCHMFAGRVAEDVYYHGLGDVSSGAGNDYEQAGRLAYMSVRDWKLFTDLTGHYLAPRQPGLIQSPDSDHAREEQEGIVNYIMDRCYRADKAFMAAIPQGPLENAMKEMEQRETLMGEQEIYEFYDRFSKEVKQACGKDLRELWREHALPILQAPCERPKD